MGKKQKKEIIFSITCSCGQAKEVEKIETSTEYEVECPQCGQVVIFEVGHIYPPPE